MKSFASLLGLLLLGCQAASGPSPMHPAPPPAAVSPAQTAPMKAVEADETAPASRDDPARWALISKILGKPGTYARDVYTITIPRDDLDVVSDLGDIPTAAGLETTIYFFKCPCGRTTVTGRFVVADYEANDVIDELQADMQIKIASMAPILLREKPRLLVIHFQGEGEAEKLANNLKGALSYTGDQRMQPIRKQD